MDCVCQFVPSLRGTSKLCVQGYLYVRDRCRGDRYHWRCDSKTSGYCNGRATTRIVDGKHVLISSSEHNHLPRPGGAVVSRIIAEVKSRAKNTTDSPCQIIQACTTSAPPNVATQLPSENALRQTINRIRREERSLEPKTLAEVDVSFMLENVSSDGGLMIKDSVIPAGRVLLFLTKNNVERLAGTSLWIMDGVFKTGPAVFYQLYTIHAAVGTDNSKTVPLVYALLSGKSKELYMQLFEEMEKFAAEIGVVLRPQKIMIALETAAFKACRRAFHGAQFKLCYFHLCQRVFKKFQSSGLVTRYNNDEDFKLKIRCLYALAFLKEDEIPNAFDALRAEVPEEAKRLMKWFQKVYVRGKVKKRLRNGAVVRSAALFPPHLWSVHDCVVDALPRTQNYVERWHNRWENVIAPAHVGLCRILQEIEREQRKIEVECERIQQEQQARQRKRHVLRREEELLRIINDRGQSPNVMEHLRALAQYLPI